MKISKPSILFIGFLLYYVTTTHASLITISIVGTQFAGDLTTERTTTLLSDINRESDINKISLQYASLIQTLQYADTSSLANKQDWIVFQPYDNGLSTLYDDMLALTSFRDIIRSNPSNHNTKFVIPIVGTGRPGQPRAVDSLAQKTLNRPDYQLLLLDKLNTLFPGEFQPLFLQNVFFDLVHEREARAFIRNDGGNIPEEAFGTNLEPLPFLRPYYFPAQDYYKEFVVNLAFATMVKGHSLITDSYSDFTINNAYNPALDPPTNYMVRFLPAFIGESAGYPIPEPNARTILIMVLFSLLLIKRIV